MLVINPENIDRELKKDAASAHHPETREWFRTVARDYVLRLDGPDKAENFIEYKPTTIKPLPGEPPLPDKLPDWARIAFECGETLWWFDPIQVRRHKVWKTIEIIGFWFNRYGSNPTDTVYAQLSFPEAEQKAKAWRSGF